MEQGKTESLPRQAAENENEADVILWEAMRVMSYNPIKHCEERLFQRAITPNDVQRAKKHGHQVKSKTTSHHHVPLLKKHVSGTT